MEIQKNFNLRAAPIIEVSPKCHGEHNSQTNQSRIILCFAAVHTPLAQVATMTPEEAIQLANLLTDSVQRLKQMVDLQNNTLQT